MHLDHTAFIDGYIPSTHVLIEQKSITKDLGAPIRQSDGSLLNPFQQAKRYSAEPASPVAASPAVAKIAETAQGILDARALYPDCSLADLYDEVTMPIELRRAHQANDRAVMQAYGFPIGMSESECVARLLEMYQALV